MQVFCEPEVGGDSDRRDSADFSQVNCVLNERLRSFWF